MTKQETSVEVAITLNGERITVGRNVDIRDVHTWKGKRSVLAAAAADMTISAMDALRPKEGGKHD